MYKRVQKTGKQPADSSTSNPFAPRPFKVESLPEPDLNQNPEIQKQELSFESSLSRLSHISIFPPGYQPPPPPRVQMKLMIGEPGDKYEQEAEKVAPNVVQQINAPLQAGYMQSQPIMQRVAEGYMSASPDEAIQAKGEMNGNSPESTEKSHPNQTGLPDELKAGVENLSGYSLDDVKVHYNSPKPAQLQALAYTQGTEIHVAPGQEEHLPHEAWHVVQQMQGRVKPTMQMKGLQINNDEGLEREADVMGKKAEYEKDETRKLAPSVSKYTSPDIKYRQGLVQRAIFKLINKEWKLIKREENEQTIDEMELRSKLPSTQTAQDKSFYNTVNKKTGFRLSDVQEAYEKDCEHLFYQLYEIIKEDDKKDPSEIDIKTKQEVIKHRKNFEELYDLAYIIYYKGAKAKPPETLKNERSPKFKHDGEIGTFDIDDSSNKKRLETQKDLTSHDAKIRSNAVSTIRGGDKTYSSYQGAIYRPFIEEERKAILGLVEAVKGSQVMFSLERGGSLIADLIEKLSGDVIENIKIPKPQSEEEATDHLNDILKHRPKEQKEYTSQKVAFEGKQKKAQQEQFKQAVISYINASEKEEITIAISETAVGGGSVNKMRALVAEICELVKESKKKVTFRILVARETIKNHGRRGQGIVKLTDEVVGGIQEGQIVEGKIVTTDPHQVEMYISELSYLIGEDVDYQMQYTGGINSDKPVIVFEAKDDTITAMSITPAPEGEDSAREVIMDLIVGAYDQLMAKIFDS
ncbi:DUF4157 domain-containing protein [Nostoc cycadae]|uniref:CAZy families GH73 protein, partial n=1 Tax=Nostoc cycadae WK-1 TaxID=1861711 RepID=A0A2H6LE97_9NOSO|nr:DUF4157 domain-containing protein [Nostoc cycadae]GBE91540.1 CAZy families GH73 protein [Nostoc cycadae WK-1]